MKISSIEGVDMGPDQDEIAEMVMEYVHDVDFEREDDFNEGAMITRACVELGWASVPQVGGLLIEWVTPAGDPISPIF